MTIVRKTAPYLIAIVASFAAAGIFIALTGANIFKAYETILFTSFRTPNGFVQTLLEVHSPDSTGFSFHYPTDRWQVQHGR